MLGPAMSLFIDYYCQPPPDACSLRGLMVSDLGCKIKG